MSQITSEIISNIKPNIKPNIKTNIKITDLIKFEDFIKFIENTESAKNIKNKKTKTILDFQAMQAAQEKIAMLTCYDASYAAILEKAGLDIILVGDSLGNVIQGHGSTLPVKLNDMIYHTRAVASGAKQTFIIADMPFGTYDNPENAYKNACELMQAGAHMVKLEGTDFLPKIVEYLAVRGIPVCAHIGLIPQFVNKLGGFKMQGKTENSANQLKILAKNLIEHGSDMLLFEAIPADLAAEITSNANTHQIPTIGIGAGRETNGQVLVLYDILGMSPHTPQFASNYLSKLMLMVQEFLVQNQLQIQNVNNDKIILNNNKAGDMINGDIINIINQNPILYSILLYIYAAKNI